MKTPLTTISQRYNNKWVETKPTTRKNRIASGNNKAMLHVFSVKTHAYVEYIASLKNQLNNVAANVYNSKKAIFLITCPE